MGQIKQEQIKGVVRNSDSTYTAVMGNGERVKLDKGEYASLERRLDKDRSRMEREGTREREQGPEKRATAKEVHERQERQRREFAERYGRR